MRKIGFSFLFIFMIVNSAAFSCDICGCYMGIIPNENYSSIAMYYRYRAFAGADYKGNTFFPDGGNLRVDHGNHGSQSSNSSTGNSTYEVYRVAELRAKYFLHPKIEINVIMPFVMNVESAGTRVNGLGDLSLYGGYQLFNSEINSSFRHRFTAGAGVKLPTGKYNRRFNNSRIDFAQQSGTGSTDFFVHATYTIAYNKLGMLINSSYKLNGKNSYNERLADSYTLNSAVFYNLSLNKNLKILPSLQAYYEYTSGLYLNNKLDKSNLMNVLMAGSGVDLYYKSLGFSFALQFPVKEQIVINGQHSTLRTIAGISWNFSQVKYPFINPLKEKSAD